MRPSMDRDCRGKPHAHGRFNRILTLAPLFLALAGCGGGGGGQSNNNGVTMSVTPLSISVSATTTQPAPSPSFEVNFSGLAINQTVYVAARPSGQAVYRVINNGGTLPAFLFLQLLPPAGMGVGAYSGSVQVQGCLDQACTQPVGDSPQTVQVQYTVTQSTFSIGGLAPASGYAGAQSFTLGVSGTNFTSLSQVLWNGTQLPTTFVNGSRLTAQVDASDLAVVGNAAVSVTDPVSGTTPPKTFVIKPSPITITRLSPATVYVQSPAFTLTVSGQGFTSQSAVLWDSIPLTTTFVSTTKLTVQVPATDIAATGSDAISVNDPAFGTSSSQILTVAPTPLALDSISPKTVTMGGPAFKLTVLGTAFTGTSVVEWNGAALTTTLVSSTELVAQVPAGDIGATGTASVTVFDPNSPPNTTSAQILTIALASKDAVSYQINAAHNGAIAFANMSFPTSPTWSVDVGGTPSYALIADGMVIVTVQLSSSAELLALDQATGNTVWGPIALSGLATATYDDGSVFVVSGSRGAFATTLQAYAVNTGALEWSKNLTGDITSTALPTAADGNVYVAPAGVLEAISESDGTTLWAKTVGGSAITAAVTVDGVYTNSSCVANDLRPATGEIIWDVSTGCSGGGNGVPVLANQLAYVSTGILDAETGASDGNYASSWPPALAATFGYFLQSGTLRGVTLSNDTLQWSFTGDGQLSGAPIAVNQYVFIGSSSGNLYAVDSATGSQVWNVNLGTAIDTNEIFGYPLSGLSAGDGLLIVPAGTKVTAYTLSTNP